MGEQLADVFFEAALLLRGIRRHLSIFIIHSNITSVQMQENEMCAVCERQPEDLLVLVCGHNLCVGCASEIFALNHSRNPFTCEICLMETHLDAETIACFESTTERNQLEHETNQVSKSKGK